MSHPESADDREPDIQDDDAQATTRAEGGDPDAEGPDSASTTGTGVSEGFVGRAAGVDDGYEGETGAERRQQAAEGS